MAELRTIPDLLARRRADRAARRALVTDDDAITYVELDDRSASLAGRLVAGGVGPHDRVALLAANGLDWAVTALAVVRIGAVLVPLSTLLRPPELQAQLEAAAVTHVIAARSFRGRALLDEARSAAGAVPSVRATWALDAIPDDAVDPALVEALGDAVRPSDDLVILFTSGSRGRPKGVIHTHAGALRATAAGLDARCVHADEVLYIPMPFFWMGGFGGGLLTALVAGATLLTEAEPEPARTLGLLQRERATLFRGWPDQAARLGADPAFADADLSSLRDGSLGAVLPPDRRPAPGARANLFGMTESFGPYCGDHLDRDMPEERWGSCGRPFAGVELRVADPDSDDEVPAGEQGEIWLRGPHVLRGIRGRTRADVFTADGWYRTGDLGRLDADGYLWYDGRLDDMFKVKGATVYPSEVEAALRSLPGVRQAHVADVGSPPEVGALVIADVDADALRAAVRERLSAFKVPTRWVVSGDAGDVPLLASGKVDKAALQELLARRGVGPS